MGSGAHGGEGGGGSPRPIGRLGAWVIAALAVTILTGGLDIVTAIQEIDVLQRRIDGEAVARAEIVEADDLLVAAEWVGAGAVFLTGVIWCTWFWRAYVDVPRISRAATAGTRSGPSERGLSRS